MTKRGAMHKCRILLRTRHLCLIWSGEVITYSTPWAIMARATFMKPATLAPFT